MKITAELPTHPFTGLRALGILPSGRPVWPVMGGNGEGSDGGGSGAGGTGGSGGSGTGGAGSGSGGTGDGGGSGGNSGGGSGSGSQDKTFTQADVDRIVGDRLRRERDQFRDYEDLKTKASEFDKIKEQNATDAEKAVNQAKKDTEATVRGQLEPQMMRLEVALAHGLPEELGKKVLSAAKRLVGATREELEADAKEFFAGSPIQTGQAGGAGGQGGGFDQGTRGGSGGGGTKASVASGADLWNQKHGKSKT